MITTSTRKYSRLEFVRSKTKKKKKKKKKKKI